MVRWSRIPNRHASNRHTRAGPILIVGLALVVLVWSGRAEAAAQSAAIPFSSNGCSGFREARFFSCCFVHDFAFWAGGTWTDRRNADRALRRCIKDISHERITADIGYFLIRLGIVPGTFINDGWGRAWRNEKRSRFAPLTADQRRWVEDERQRVCRSLTLNPGTGKYRVDGVREIRADQAREICGGVIRPSSLANSLNFAACPSVLLQDSILRRLRR